jgi:mRNA-degrading endonuclease RelE of RelBE toxin-antitoxin system
LAWTIELSDTAKKSLRKLDRQVSKRIAVFLRDRVAQLDDPRTWGRRFTRRSKTTGPAAWATIASSARSGTGHLSS